jgi:hypothetical protein
MDIVIEILINTGLVILLLYLLLLILIRRGRRVRGEAGRRYMSSLGMGDRGFSGGSVDSNRAGSRRDEENPGFGGDGLDTDRRSEERRKIIYLSERRKRLGK